MTGYARARPRAQTHRATTCFGTCVLVECEILKLKLNIPREFFFFSFPFDGQTGCSFERGGKVHRFLDEALRERARPTTFVRRELKR